MLSTINKRIPSWKWCIVFGTIGTIGSAIGYDRYARAKIQKAQFEIAHKVAHERLSPFEKVRRVKVFMQKTPWAEDWVKKYVKPVFDESALDYELYSLDQAELENNVKMLLLNGWKDNRNKTNEDEKSFIKDITIDKYDHNEGLVAVGEEQFIALITGISRSHKAIQVNVQDDSSRKFFESFKYPAVGLIKFYDLSGWRNLGTRLKMQFITRYTTMSSGEEALKICFGNVQRFDESDVSHGLNLKNVQNIPHDLYIYS